MLADEAEAQAIEEIAAPADAGLEDKYGSGDAGADDLTAQYMQKAAK